MPGDPEVVVSVTPEIALDIGHTYAGGLGVLEGDKFYAAARLGLKYYAITLLYTGGYVDYEYDEARGFTAKPQDQSDLLRELSKGGELEVELQGSKVRVSAWEYRRGSATAVFLKPEDPRFAHLAERLYIESDQRERFLKYTLLAKGAAEYVKHFIGLENVQYIDLQEAYTAMIPLALRIPGRYRLIVHTPGPWGHPSFPNAFFREEYGYYFIEDPVVLTSVGAALAWEVILVSAKHYDVMKKVVPHFIYKARFITNGIELDRWMHPDLRKSLERGELTLSSLSAVRQRVRAELLKLLKSRKPGLREDSMIVLWARRLTRYKRPYFAARLVEEERDGGVVYVLGGKAHPHDSEGLAYMRQFKDLEKKYPNVVYFHDYDVVRAKLLLQGSDLLLFTPFSGWEACGTSFMKAAVNGVPSLASRDGGVVELVVDNVNGWLFGEDIRDLSSLSGERAARVDERDYAELKARFERVKGLYFDEREEYLRVSLNAILTFVPRVDMTRVLKEYYPDLVR